MHVPEHDKELVAAPGDEGDMDALAAYLVTVEAADSTDGLLQRKHLDRGLQLVVSVGAKVHTLYLDQTQNTWRDVCLRCYKSRVMEIA